MNGKEKLGIDKIKCPECGKVTDSILWQECEVGCEDCGSHQAIKCPECGEGFDHVWGYDKLLESSAFEASELLNKTLKDFKQK